MEYFLIHNLTGNSRSGLRLHEHEHRVESY